MSHTMYHDVIKTCLDATHDERFRIAKVLVHRHPGIASAHCPPSHSTTSAVLLYFASRRPSMFLKAVKEAGSGSDDFAAELRSTYERDGKIQAIKLYRRYRGCSLSDAKGAVEAAARAGDWSKPSLSNPW